MLRTRSFSYSDSHDFISIDDLKKQQSDKEKVLFGIVDEHQKLISSLLDLYDDDTVHLYNFLAQGISNLPKLPIVDEFFHLDELPTHYGVDLFTLVIEEQRFSPEQRIQLLNKLFEKGYEPLWLFNSKNAVSIMCSSPKWSEFILYHYRILISDAHSCTNIDATKNKLSHYLLRHHPEDLLLTLQIELQENKVTIEEYLKIIQQLINMQSKESIVEMYEMITAIVTCHRIGEKCLSDIQKMTKIRSLELEIKAAQTHDKQNHAATTHDSLAEKKTEAFLKTHRGIGFFCSIHLQPPTSWRIYKKMHKGDDKSLQEAITMHEKEKNEFEETFKKKFHL